VSDNQPPLPHAYDSFVVAVRAVLKAEQERDEARAALAQSGVAIDRLTDLASVESERHIKAEAKVRRVEALAAKFDRWPSSPSLSVAAKAIRAALADPEATP
jgi:crotonobetainyl-CoA:carnitine CoA-transferase CaiB-like acyl-CoA transferase